MEAAIRCNYFFTSRPVARLFYELSANRASREAAARKNAPGLCFQGSCARTSKVAPAGSTFFWGDAMHALSPSMHLISGAARVEARSRRKRCRCLIRLERPCLAPRTTTSCLTVRRTRAETPGNESRKRRTLPIAFLALRRDTATF